MKRYRQRRRGEVRARSSTRQARVPPAQERVRRLMRSTLVRQLVPLVDPPIERLPKRRPLSFPKSRLVAQVRSVRRVARRMRHPLQRLWSSVAPEKRRGIAYCVARKVRKQVLHALGIAGRRASPGRGGTYNRTPESQMRC